jgi:hypothetical protein
MRTATRWSVSFGDEAAVFSILDAASHGLGIEGLSQAVNEI